MMKFCCWWWYEAGFVALTIVEGTIEKDDAIFCSSGINDKKKNRRRGGVDSATICAFWISILSFLGYMFYNEFISIFCHPKIL